MVAKSGVWAHLPARAYWDLTAVWSARIVVQSAPLVALGMWELSVGSGLAMGLRLGACLGRWGGHNTQQAGQVESHV